jgi:uncharacterized repeat protein (TIGR01451 family)
MALACAFFLAQGVAMSEETAPPLRHILEIKATVKPAELVAPGDVTVNLTISNPSDYDANNITLASSDGLHSEPLGQIAAGGSQVFTRAYSVSQEELDAGEITFILSHDGIASDDAPVNYTVAIQIAKSEAKPDIEFTRQISSRAVTAGTTVTVTYRVKNTGNVALTQIRVRDSLGEYTGRVDALEPGEAKVFSSRVTVNQATASQARVSYVAEAVSDDAVTKELDDAQIEVVAEALTATLALDRDSAAAGDTVNGVLTIAAEGVDFAGIDVTDDVYGTVLADALELKAGATITLTCSWPVRGPSDYRIRVSGIAATGDEVEVVTNTARVTLTGGFAESALSITAVAATPVISKPGGVKVTVAIENAGNAAARDVTLSEATLGEIRTFAFVPTGDATYRDVICEVKDDARFVFAATYTDDSGQTVTVLSDPVEIRIGSGGALPEIAQEDGGGFVDWIKRSVDDSITYVWMLAIAGAVLIILTVTLIVSHFRERRVRRQKLDKEKQRRREELGRTTKFEPVKRPAKQNKRGGTDV